MRMTVNWHKGFTSCCASFTAPTANLLRLPMLFFKDVSVLAMRFCTGGLYSAQVNMPAAGLCLQQGHLGVSPCLLLHQYPLKPLSFLVQMRDIALSLDNEFITTRDCFEFKVCSCSTGCPKPDGSLFVGPSSLGCPASRQVDGLHCLIP